MGVFAARAFGGACVVLAGARCIAGSFKVFGGQAQQAFGAQAAQGRKPGRGARVPELAVALEHRVVGHLAQDVVGKGVFTRIGQAGSIARQRQLPLHQGRQGRRCGRVQLGQGRLPEHHADHGGLLQGQAFGGRQAVQAGLHHAGQSGRHAAREQAAGVQCPALLAHAQRTLVDQHLDQLFHEEGVAGGARGEQGQQLRRNLRQAAQQLHGQRGAGLCIQRLQFDGAAGMPFAPGRPAFKQRGPRQAQDQCGHVVVDAAEVVQKIQRAFVGPMQVVQGDEQRAAIGQTDAPQRLRGGMEGA